jgi:4-amino-4-deoxy-L-arabinose transferase-like glycosyltransferase
MLLAIGHEFVLGSYLGPPLAFWFGEIAFRLAGSLGLYVLAQACIVIAYWAVFALGRGIVGTRHAVLAVLLMVGIAAFTVPSPNFGPAILAAPLWALALLYYWRAVGESRRGHWFLLALVLGLLVLASYVGLILLVVMIVFTLATARGRAAAFHPEPWIAMLLLCIVVFPHALWFSDGRTLVMEGIEEGATSAGRLSPGTWLCLVLILTHLGLALLVTLASGWPRHPRERAPEIDRNPVEPFARNFVYVFALAPALVAIAIAFAGGRLGPLDRIAPLVVLSGLAVIVAAGDKVLLYRERLVSSAWLGLLVAPPVLVALSIAVFPWTVGIDLRIAQPANAEGSFYSDIYQRRTGKPLPYVTGDPRIAPLVALAAPSRPHVYFAWAPQRSPWASPTDVLTRGGILVWPAADNTGTPPTTLKAQFPDMVQEVPRSFPRAVQGRLPLIRLGWSMLRPLGAP